MFEDYTKTELGLIFRSFLEAYPLDPSERAKDDGAFAGKPNPHRLVLNPGQVLAVCTMRALNVVLPLPLVS